MAENNFERSVSTNNNKGISENLPLSFLYKKTEKLISATYLVTDLFSDDEPLKWSLRKKVLLLLPKVLSLRAPILPVTKTGDITIPVLEIVTHLEVALSAGVISEMNFKVMTKEFLELLRQIELGKHLPESQTNLSDDFFSPERREHDDLASRLDQSDRRERYSKGHGEMSFRNAYSSVNSGAVPNARRPFLGVADEKSLGAPSRFSSDRLGMELRKSSAGPQKTKYSDSRRKTIVSLFKNNKDTRLSVKDVHRVIKDCSEKTVQRELVSMVTDGLLKKEGEKRWSRYRLA